MRALAKLPFGLILLLVLAPLWLLMQPFVILLREDKQ